MSGSTTKTSGLSDDFYVAGYHVGGDVQALSVHGGPKLLDVTDITQSAHSRLCGLRDAGMDVTTYHDPAANAAHDAFKGLPTADAIMSYLRGQVLGNPVAMLNAKQVGYDPTRANDGSLTFKTQGMVNAYTSLGLEWGFGLTAGLRTDTADTNGTAVNNLAAGLYGAQAYLQAVSLTGTSGTVTIQHAPDDATWTTLLSFAAVSAPPVAQRLATISGPFTATDASPCVFTLTSGGAAAPVANTPVSIAATPGTVLPGGFTAGTTYYVVSPSGATFELSATSGGSAINSSSAGAGYLYQVAYQYLRAITTGTFTSFAFQCGINVNPVAVIF